MTLINFLWVLLTHGKGDNDGQIPYKSWFGVWMFGWNRIIASLVSFWLTEIGLRNKIEKQSFVVCHPLIYCSITELFGDCMCFAYLYWYHMVWLTNANCARITIGREYTIYTLDSVSWTLMTMCGAFPLSLRELRNVARMMYIVGGQYLVHVV